MTNKEKKELSRRNFIKKLGAGVIGLGALTMSPVSALNVKDNDFDVFTGADTSSLEKYFSISQGGPVRVQNTNLELPTDRSIEDDQGNNRFSLNSGDTVINNEAGRQAILLRDGSRHRIEAYSDTPLIIRDNEGDFQGIRYNTNSSSPGTLQLTNADLDINTNSIKNLSDPNNNQDAATKNYVDNNSSSAEEALAYDFVL